MGYSKTELNWAMVIKNFEYNLNIYLKTSAKGFNLLLEFAKISEFNSRFWSFFCNCITNFTKA